MSVYINLDFITRGTTFWKTFARIGEVRSIIPQRVHVMALTNTATKAMRKDIMQKLGMVAKYRILSHRSSTMCKRQAVHRIFR